MLTFYKDYSYIDNIKQGLIVKCFVMCHVLGKYNTTPLIKTMVQIPYDKESYYPHLIYEKTEA